MNEKDLLSYAVYNALGVGPEQEGAGGSCALLWAVQTENYGRQSNACATGIQS